jgi:hypothetical protein
VISGPLGRNPPSGLANRQRRVPWGEGAEELFDDFERKIESVVETKPTAYELLARVPEYALRLATLHAISCDGPVKAPVEVADLGWGAAWAIESAKSMMQAAENVMASNPYERDLNKVRAFIRESGEVSSTDLLREFRDIKSRDLDEYTSRLVKTGEFETIQKPTKGRPGTSYRPRGQTI